MPKQVYFSRCCSAEKQHVFLKFWTVAVRLKHIFGMLLSFENWKCLKLEKTPLFTICLACVFFYKTRQQTLTSSQKKPFHPVFFSVASTWLQSLNKVLARDRSLMKLDTWISVCLLLQTAARCFCKLHEKLL